MISTDYIGEIAMSEQRTGAQEPYGYVWFDRNMEQRFTNLYPKRGPVGEVTPVYVSPPVAPAGYRYELIRLAAPEDEAPLGMSAGDGERP